jgi:hypothetical protein
MLECITKECPSSKDGRCILDKNQSHAKCVDRKQSEDKTIKVICIDNEDYPDRLTLYKEYTVIEKEEEYYIITDDKGEEENYYQSRFKPVEQQKEYSVMELLDFPIGTQFEVKGNNKIVEVVGHDSFRKIKCKWLDKYLVLSSQWLEERFVKIEQPIPINYEEEYKNCYQESEKCPKNEKGKCIDSKICGNQYPAGFDFELECFRLQKENEELKEKVENYRSIKNLMKILAEGL